MVNIELQYFQHKFYPQRYAKSYKEDNKIYVSIFEKNKFEPMLLIVEVVDEEKAKEKILAFMSENLYIASEDKLNNPIWDLNEYDIFSTVKKCYDV